MKYFLIICICLATSHILASSFISPNETIEISEEIKVDE